MKNKKILILLTFILIIIIFSLFIIVKKFNFSNQDKQENILDYTPQEEIDLKALRQTNINLYFIETRNK